MKIEEYVLSLGQKAKAAAFTMAKLGATEKNHALLAIADALIANEERILAVNREEVATAEAAGLKSSFVERLTLNRARIAGMVEGIREIVRLDDPVGNIERMWQRPNGLQIGQVRVPLGVVAIIYEARPNVTVDAAALCLKTGNSVLLRGGSEALRTNEVLVEVMREALSRTAVPQDALQLIASPQREAAVVLMKMREYVDVLIPRGGAGLIKTVVDNAQVPVIETGVGNCHIFVDASAQLPAAVEIVLNAKTQRPSVCNALETLLVHQEIAPRFLPLCGEELRRAGVEIRGCPQTLSYLPWAEPATPEDWATEYLDLTLAVKVVPDFAAAVDHIHRYGTGHSESILTTDYAAARRFLQEVDAAAVYVNASTRFTDGFEFGFGAEVGISTQKLHARGPMGLQALTTIKYIIYGDGQIRK
ncbi:MAG: glutamate-5-semialdehyde dehydrogenase [Firmicutes bacterium]|nr:glutamate-5-semialdehyde dehydrogenase [Bacillota bacterium]